VLTDGILGTVLIKSLQDPRKDRPVFKHGRHILRWEWVPMKGYPEGSYLLHHFRGPRGDRFIRSEIHQVKKKRITFGIKNNMIAVDRVVVREIREEARPIPKPRTDLYGDVLFEDDFDENIDRWDVLTSDPKVHTGSLYRVDGDRKCSWRIDTGKLSVVRQGRERFWKIEPDYQPRRGDPATVSCLFLHPHVVEMVKEDPVYEHMAVALRSRDEIRAERFVINLHCWSHKRGGAVSDLYMNGIVADGSIERLQESKNVDSLPPGPHIFRWEIEPAKGYPEGYLLLHFFQRHEGDRYVLSEVFRPKDRRILFGIRNNAFRVDRVVVRKMRRDDGAGEQIR
jgi:hypothetical protein